MQPRQAKDRPRNAELWQLFRELAEAVTPLLFAKVRAGHQVRYAIRERFRRSPQPRSGFEYFYEPLWINLLRANEEPIVSLPAYTSIRQHVVSDPAVKSFVLKRYLIGADQLTENMIGTYFHGMFIEAFLIKAVAMSVGLDKPKAPEKELLELYCGLEADLYDEPALWQALAPAIRLSAEVDLIELSDKHRIRGLNEEDRTRWVTAADFEGIGGSGVHKLMTTHALEVDQVRNQDSASGITKVNQLLSQNSASLITEVEHAMTLLRLFRRGGLAIPAAIIGRPKDWLSERWWIARAELTPAHMAGSGYHLWPADVEPLKRMWAWYSKKTHRVQGRVEIALRRFNRARSDESIEDRLIDACVGFDSLLGMGSGNQELTYKICQRGSFLLGRDVPERTHVFDTLALAYRARGSIIHGAELPAKAFTNILRKGGIEKPAEDWVEDVTALLAGIIRAWLSFPTNVEPLKDQPFSGKGTDKTLDANITQCGDLLRPHLKDWVYLPGLFEPHHGPWSAPASPTSTLR